MLPVQKYSTLSSLKYPNEAAACLDTSASEAVARVFASREELTKSMGGGGCTVR